MTSELKPCPFCGSDNVFVQCMVYMLEGYKRHYVECYDCGADVGVIKNPSGTFGAFYETKQQAIEAWNTRIERTCHNVSKSEHSFRCSECDAADLDFQYPDYCHGCGAKVVSE